MGAGVSGRHYVPPTKKLDAEKVLTHSGHPGITMGDY